ncbi:hypothetical protein F5888DRAFT_1631681 [Russula emetica]|nr:hypothetical protein F5888DRAFT_1631681 [Russula emetica]
MPLIYSDSFQDNEDLCNILAALQIRSHPMSAVRDPGGVVAQVAGSTHRVRNETPTGSPPWALHDDKPLPPITERVWLEPVPDGIDNISSGEQTGVRNTQAHAEDVSQGIDGDEGAKLHILPLQHQRRCEAYVVFEGLAFRIYSSWVEVEPLVKGIPGNIHQGFRHHRKAEHAYVLAFAMGALRTLLARHDMDQQVPASAMPMSEAVMAAFALAADNFLGAEWYVVFKGKRPGVYPAWQMQKQRLEEPLRMAM